VKLLKGLLTSLLLLVALSVRATPPPAPTERITDLVGVMDANTKSKLATELKDLEKKNGSQIIVYITKTFDGPLEQWTNDAARAWKIGQKDNNNGAIFFIFMDKKRARIEVGTGLEGALSDIVTKRVYDEIVRPQFKAGHFSAGVYDGTHALIRLASGEKFDQVKPHMSVGVLILLIAIIILFIIAVAAGGELSDSFFGSSSSSGSIFGGGGSFDGGGSSGDW
jgi:uncharacterized protein